MICLHMMLNASTPLVDHGVVWVCFPDRQFRRKAKIVGHSAKILMLERWDILSTYSLSMIVVTV